MLAGFEITVWFLVLLTAWQVRSRPARLATMAAGALLGLAIEVLFVNWLAGYSYGPALLQVPTPGGPIPLWVAAGWGAIVATVQDATEQLELQWWGRPACDALLAVVLDLALDPVAQGLGMWTWDNRPGPFFGVPWDNFLGWYAIVGGYGAASRLLLWRWGGGWRDVVLPLVALVPAAVGVFLWQLLLEAVYPLTGEGPPFLVATLALCGLVWASSGLGRLEGRLHLLGVPCGLSAALLAASAADGLLAREPMLLAVLPMGAALALLTFWRR